VAYMSFSNRCFPTKGEPRDHCDRVAEDERVYIDRSRCGSCGIAT
jgi:hypothetical protein